MSEIVTAVALIASLFMGISIGSSTVASTFAPVNSSGTANLFRSALLAGLFALLGAVTQGANVTETVGSGIIDGEIVLVQAAIILMVAALLVIVSVLTDYPMPTAFTVIGAVIGTGLGFGDPVKWAEVSRIIGYWILVPLVSLPLGYLIAKALRKYISKENSEQELNILLLLSGSYLAYSAGASAVGLAVGPLTALQMDSFTLLAFGGISILLGTWMYSPRIINAISFDYSDLGPRRSIAALAAAGFMAQIGVFLGIPISFNEAVIASVVGSGMVTGRGEGNSTKILRTALMWTSAFLLSILLTFLISSML